MKNLIFLLMIISIFSCKKSEKKSNDKNVTYVFVSSGTQSKISYKSMDAGGWVDYDSEKDLNQKEDFSVNDNVSIGKQSVLTMSTSQTTPATYEVKIIYNGKVIAIANDLKTVSGVSTVRLIKIYKDSDFK